MKVKIYTLFLENDLAVVADEVKNSDDEFLNDATVQITLLDASGEEVTGQEWPLSLDYVESSSGQYKGTLSAECELVEGESYEIEFRISNNGGNAVWRLPAVAKVRRSF